MYKNKIFTIIRWMISLAIKIKSSTRNFKAHIKYHMNLHSNQTVVTIFGSCRQDSLYEKFAVTRIRERLTYSHYIEETIQAIKYCKNMENTSELKMGAFRVDLLGKKRLRRKSLMSDFEKTQVFVVEIASLLEYTDGHHFYHHEAYDSRNLKLNIHKKSPTESDVTVIKGDLQMTAEKLDRLFELIPKEKTVLVSHIATRESTDRWKLNEEVRKYASINNIEYFNPSEILAIWPLESICEIEPVISHFTKIGHEIVGDRLAQHIYKVSTRAPKGVIHKYAAQSEIGFGDFVFGSIFLKQLAANANTPIYIDLNQHPLSSILKMEWIPYNSSDVISLFHNDSVRKFVGSGAYISNRRPREINAGDRDFIMRTLLNTKKRISSEESEFCKAQGNVIETVFHVRLGDDIAFNGPIPDHQTVAYFDEIAESIAKILGNFTNFDSYIILSDSKSFREYVSSRGLRTSVRNVSHFNAQRDESDETLINMMDEYLLMVSAKNIIQFSVYGWGSGFSESAVLVGGGKLTKFVIQSMS